MTKYFKLQSSNYVDYGIQRTPTIGEQSVMLGRLVEEEKLPSLVFEHNFPPGEPMPHYLTGGTCLASKRLLGALESVGVYNYQAFPAALVNPETGDRREDYFLFNVLGLMKVANLDESDYDELMGGNPEGVDLPLTAFNDLAIDGKKAQDVDMFRLAEEPISVIVSEKVVKGLKDDKPDEGWGVVVEEVKVV